MKYHNHLNYRARKRFLRRLRIAAVLLFLIIAAGGGYLWYSIAASERQNTTESTTSQVTKSYFAPSVRIFRTPFYQFQTDQSWVEVAGESTSNKFIYRSLRSNLIEHELIIYVNQIPANLNATRILPVQQQQSKLTPAQVSDHCSKAVTAASGLGNSEVTLDRVKFNCDSDGTVYTVLAGLIDGSSTIVLTRPDKSQIAYAMYYTNLKANNDAVQLSQIIDSFQPR